MTNRRKTDPHVEIEYLVRAAKASPEAAEALFRILQDMPKPRLVWTLYQSLLNCSDEGSEANEKSGLTRMLSCLENRVPENSPLVFQVRRYEKSCRNLGYYRIHILLGGRDLGPMRFRHKQSAIVLLLSFADCVLGEKKKRSGSLIEERPVFVKAFNLVYDLSREKVEEIFNGLKTDPTVHAQGSLRMVYSDINQAMTDLVGPLADVTPYEVHRGSGFTAPPGCVEIGTFLKELI